MSVVNLTITICCDECRLEGVYEPMDENSDYHNWFESLTFDLCPKCKLTEKGIERIIGARRAQADATAKYCARK